jgi:hypothetical protein
MIRRIIRKVIGWKFELGWFRVVITGYNYSIGKPRQAKLLLTSSLNQPL